jgi:menaquinone-dependent protoporphyrinogen oxidase
VVAKPADEVADLEGIEAAIVGGALYANRWPANVRRFVRRNVRGLRKVPVWFFSSGPLDDSADRTALPASNEVAALAERVGAKAHVTFGGRLEKDAKGFPAAAMAKEHAGDWRNPERIRRWADGIGELLPIAVPGEAIDHPARGVWRWVAYGFIGWAACAALMGVLLQTVGLTAAMVLHAIAAPLIFVPLARRYFLPRGAREPLATAIFWVALIAGLDAVVVAWLFGRGFEMFASFAGMWLPLALIFGATWATGTLVSTLPWPKLPAKPPTSAARSA